MSYGPLSLLRTFIFLLFEVIGGAGGTAVRRRAGFVCGHVCVDTCRVSVPCVTCVPCACRVCAGMYSVCYVWRVCTGE